MEVITDIVLVSVEIQGQIWDGECSTQFSIF